MFATVVWLISVFAATTGRTGATLLLFVLALVSMILWIYGRFFQRAARVLLRTPAALTGRHPLAGRGHRLQPATALCSLQR